MLQIYLKDIRVSGGSTLKIWVNFETMKHFDMSELAQIGAKQASLEQAGPVDKLDNK